MHTEPTRQAESPSLDAELPLTDSETESDEVVPVINAGDQDEGHARPNPSEQDEGQTGPNPGLQDEGQAGSNPGDAAESQPQPSHGVHVGQNREHMDFEATNASSQQKPEKMDEDSTGTLSSLQNLDKDLIFTDHIFMEKPHEEESGKTNAKKEVQSMVLVPIHQDTSSVPLMTTSVIDLMTIQSDSPLPTSIETTSIITTTTSLPPPPQPQQSIADLILVGQIRDPAIQLGESQYSPQDLPTVDMKEILQQRMFEDNSYKAHEAHNDLYEALQKSLELDYSNKHLVDQEEAHKKKRKKHVAPRTPSGFPPSPPPPPPPPAGASGAPGSKAPSSSKLVASIYQSMAWTTSDIRFESTSFMVALELSPTDYLMQDDSIPKEQVHLSDDEDSENDHQPKADLRKDWWNPYLKRKDQRLLNLPGLFLLPTNLEYLRYGSKGSNPVLSISKIKAASYPDFGLELLKFYIDKHDSPSCRKDVRTHMRILNFKNLYPSDFEDLNLLLLQGHLDHLPGSDKRMLSTAVKQWTRNLVIQQRVEDFQLGIESYQTQLNLTRPGWDATGYEFKHDYTIIKSPRVVVFLVDNNNRKIMRFNEIYKFSDGTLTRILEALDCRVKEFKVKRINPCMNMRFWTQKDVTRSKEFIAAIERRLKTRRIFQNLECFVGGRVRDIDYRLLHRTEYYCHYN
ncbi:hypothetical protein Tco_1239896 [Tanacetum coccineum]